MLSLSPIVRDPFLDLFSLPPDAPRGLGFAPLVVRLQRVREIFCDGRDEVEADSALSDHLGKSGTILRDLWILLTDVHGDPERVEAGRRLRPPERKLLADPDARRAALAASEEQDVTLEDLLDWLWIEALLLAAVYGDHPQRIRFGRHYVKDEDGRPAKIAPDDLPNPIELLLAWLWKEARNALEAILVGRPYPPMERPDALGAGMSIEGLEHIADQTDEAEDHGSDAPNAPDAEQVVARLRSVAAPREREMLDLLLIRPGATNVEIARRMGIRPGTVGAMKARLRTKAARPVSQPV